VLEADIDKTIRAAFKSKCLITMSPFIKSKLR